MYVLVVMRERRGKISETQTYRRRYQLGDAFVEDEVPLCSISILGNQEIEKGMGSVDKGLAEEVIASDGVLVVGEALDAEQLPGAKGVEDEAFLGPLAPRPHAERLCRVSAQR